MRQLMSFPAVGLARLGDRPVQAVTEDDVEAFVRHLGTLGRAASTRNHYAETRWAARSEASGEPGRPPC